MRRTPAPEPTMLPTVEHERSITGALHFHTTTEVDASMAMTLFAELTARMRSHGWNCDDIRVTVGPDIRVLRERAPVA